MISKQVYAQQVLAGLLVAIASFKDISRYGIDFAESCG